MDLGSKKTGEWRAISRISFATKGRGGGAGVKNWVVRNGFSESRGYFRQIFGTFACCGRALLCHAYFGNDITVRGCRF